MNLKLIDIVKGFVSPVKIRFGSAKAFIGYIFLTLALTYPVITKFFNHIPGTGGDNWVNIWYMWWLKKSIFELHLNPLYTSHLFYPTGVSLASHALTLNLVVSLPLQFILSSVSIHNLFFLLSFILPAFGMYLLLKYLTGNQMASFVGGIIFAFCPFRFMHSQGWLGQTVSSMWLPFYVLYLIKIVKEEAKINAIWASVFLIFVSLSDWHHMMHAVIFSGLFLFYQLWTNRMAILNKKFLIRFSLVVFLFILISLPFAYPFILDTFSTDFPPPPPSGSICYSADLLSFFVPNQIHSFLGKYTSNIPGLKGNPGEKTTYVGLTVLLLSLYSILLMRKKKEIKFWMTSAIFFFLLALGPILQVNGRTHFTPFQTTIPLPYIALYSLFPFLKVSRVPNRFAIMLIFSLAILAGYGFKLLLTKVKGKRLLGRFAAGKILAILIPSLIIFEFLAIPFPVSNATIPSIYQKIAKDKGDYAILEVPFMLEGIGYRAEYMYYQTVHEKKLLDGIIARVPSRAKEFIENTPVMHQFQHARSLEDILNQDISKIGLSLLDHYDIRYVIAHLSYLYTDTDKLAIFQNLLKKIFGDVLPVYQDKKMVAYKVRKVENPVTFMTLGHNWYPKELCDEIPTRMMRNNATLIIVSPTSQKVKIKFTARSLDISKALDIYHNNKLIGSYLIETAEKDIITPTIEMFVGENEIRFLAPDSPEPKIRFQGVTLIEAGANKN